MVEIVIAAAVLVIVATLGGVALILRAVDPPHTPTTLDDLMDGER